MTGIEKEILLGVTAELEASVAKRKLSVAGSLNGLPMWADIELAMRKIRELVNDVTAI